MKTTALRLYGKKDVRLETFELPPIRDDEILVKLVCDSLCMSSYKAAQKGPGHKRVPADVAENPTVLGHEFCGEIVEVGAKWRGKYAPGMRFVIQTGMKETYDAIGYSFPYMGGDMTYGIIPAAAISGGYVLPYGGDAFFYGALVEPLSCVTGAVHGNYHTVHGEYTHAMGIKAGGKAAALAAVGPMGLAMLDYLIHRDERPSLLVVTDIDAGRLARAGKVLPAEDAKRHGVELVYVNTGGMDDPKAALRALSGGSGFDDVFVFAPVPAVVEQGGAILAYDGCLNFFAGPENEAFSAPFNFYDVHYNATHIAGTSGGNTDDMIESLALAAAGRIDPAILVTHVGGLDSAAEATLDMPRIGGGKKLIYTHVSMPLTAIADFGALGENDPFFAELDVRVQAHNGLWNVDAERYLLEYGKRLCG
ncbi:MAG: zinc-binding dehydrogenase [Clostridiales Family XIII bacterium]|jgi:threonine dehydrogenase-like Zn-dependent dehydrogenase|nr:zinc-binding dehydrogenase [Clostridiales Family XIII bacterium]